MDDKNRLILSIIDDKNGMILSINDKVVSTKGTDVKTQTPQGGLRVCGVLR
jgi:hypothetical protein